MKIGLISDSFRLPFAESISAAAKLGVTGVQKYMTGGPFTAENLPPSSFVRSAISWIPTV